MTAIGAAVQELDDSVRCNTHLGFMDGAQEDFDFDHGGQTEFSR